MPFHEVSDEASDLGGVQSDLLDDPLVGIEVKLGVVILDQDPGSLRPSLGSDTSHFGFLSFLQDAPPSTVKAEPLRDVPEVELAWTMMPQ